MAAIRIFNYLLQISIAKIVAPQAPKAASMTALEPEIAPYLLSSSQTPAKSAEATAFFEQLRS